MPSPASLALVLSAFLLAAAPAAPGSGRIECTCRANGRSYALGERACLNTPCGPRMAECRMSQNVTSWVVQGEEGCVVSQLRLTRAAC